MELKGKRGRPAYENTPVIQAGPQGRTMTWFIVLVLIDKNDSDHNWFHHYSTVSIQLEPFLAPTHNTRLLNFIKYFWIFVGNSIFRDDLNDLKPLQNIFFRGFVG